MWGAHAIADKKPRAAKANIVALPFEAADFRFAAGTLDK
jgi:hypothetical protein